MIELTKDQTEILKRAGNVFTEKDQLIKLMEELSELQKEAAKIALGEKFVLTEFWEETIDVLIMIQQFIIRWERPTDNSILVPLLQKELDEKINRLNKKMDELVS